MSRTAKGASAVVLLSAATVIAVGVGEAPRVCEGMAFASQSPTSPDRVDLIGNPLVHGLGDRQLTVVEQDAAGEPTYRDVGAFAAGQWYNNQGEPVSSDIVVCNPLANGGVATSPNVNVSGGASLSHVRQAVVDLLVMHPVVNK